MTPPLSSTPACDTSRRPRHLTPRHAKRSHDRPSRYTLLITSRLLFAQTNGPRALVDGRCDCRRPRPRPRPRSHALAPPPPSARTQKRHIYSGSPAFPSYLLALSFPLSISLSLSVPPCRRPEIPAVCSIRRRMYSARRACYSRMFLITFRARHASLLPWVLLLLLISSHFNYCTFFLR